MFQFILYLFQTVVFLFFTVMTIYVSIYLFIVDKIYENKFIFNLILLGQ